MTRSLILLLTIPLAACDPLNALTGEPTEYRKYHERLQAVEARFAQLDTEPEISPVVAAPQPVPEPIIEPECVPVFRIRECPED